MTSALQFICDHIHNLGSFLHDEEEIRVFSYYTFKKGGGNEISVLRVNELHDSIASRALDIMSSNYIIIHIIYNVNRLIQRTYLIAFLTAMSLIALINNFINSISSYYNLLGISV